MNEPYVKKPQKASTKKYKSPSNNRPDRIANQMRQALTLWEQWLGDDKWHQLDRWLKHTLGKNKKYGKRDRLFYGDVLFNAARFGYLAAIALKSEGAKPANAIAQFSTLASNASRLKQQLLNIARSNAGEDFLALCQWRAQPETPLPQALNQYKRFLNNLRDYADEHDDGALSWQGIPVNYLTQANYLGDSTRTKFIAAQSKRPPLWLRLNHEKQRHTVLTELLEFYTIDDLDGAIAIQGDRGIFGLECYKQGWVEIQDWASQQLTKRIKATPGQKIWDACAGGGGKTQAIASTLNNKGAVWATDIREYKLDEVKRRAKLAGFFNIRTAPWQGDTPLKLPKEIANDGGFDWVLVDAPCSSSGTWRRNPDAKLRNLGEDLSDLNALQLQILNQASQSVNRKGKLVYGTCSFFQEENQHIITRFLESNDDWQLESSELLGCPEQNSDTLFAATLSRKSN